MPPGTATPDEHFIGEALLLHPASNLAAADTDVV